MRPVSLRGFDPARARELRVTSVDRTLASVGILAAATAAALWAWALLVELPEGPGAAARALAQVDDLLDYGGLALCVALTCLIVFGLRRLRA
jgi:hypothetical protein